MITRGAARRIVAIILGVAVALGGAFPIPTQTTAAAFTDSERANGVLTAAVLVRPQNLVVSNCSNLLGSGSSAGVTIQWGWPTTNPYTGFTPASNAQWAFNAAGDNWQAVATQSAGAGRYRTTFNTGVIPGLLTMMVGGKVTFRVRTKVGTNWVSSTSAAVEYTAPVVGSPTCVVLP